MITQAQVLETVRLHSNRASMNELHLALCPRGRSSYLLRLRVAQLVQQGLLVQDGYGNFHIRTVNYSNVQPSTFGGLDYYA